jgi:RNase adaptor protein for sRNA GlmZ degradation
VRFLRNPHYVPELQPLPGTHPAVRDYVLSENTQLFLGDWSGS